MTLSRPQARRAAALTLGLAACLAAAAPAPANVIIYDPFTDGGFTNGADLQDAAWTGSGSTSLSVANDAVIGDGNALIVNSTGSFAQLRANLDQAISLTKDRERFKIELDLRMVNNPNVGEGWRTGLRNDDGTQYFLTAGTGGNTGVNLKANGTGYFGGGSQVTVAGDGNGSTLDDTTPHVVVFTVQRTDAGRIDLSGRLDNRVISGVDTSVLNTTFTHVGGQTGNNTNIDYNLDNYTLTRWINRIDDTFDSAGATTGDDANDPNDTRWFRGSTGTTLSVVGDDNGAGGEIGSNNAMNVDNNASFQRIYANVDPVNLNNIGYSAELSFDVRLLSDATTQGGGFRFGLFDTNDTRITADGQTAFDDDDQGYHVQVGVGTGNTALVQEFVGDGSTLGGPTANDTVASGSFFLDDTLPHYFVYRLTRVDGGLLNQLWVDGVLVASGIDDDTPFFAFDQIAFGTGGANFDYRLDNIVLDVHAVPTPAALPAGLALIALASTRRRRSR